MPLIVRRQSFLSHLWTILVTPICFVGASALLKWRQLLAVVLAMLLAWCCGAKFDLGWFTQENLLILAGIVIFLWFVATLLSVFDHFRYQGWMTVLDDKLEEDLLAFVSPLLLGEFSSAYERCSARYQREKSAESFMKVANHQVAKLRGCQAVMPLGMNGRFDLPILSGSLPMLREMNDSATAAIALVLLMIPGVPIERNHVPTLRVKLVREQSGYRVDAFDAVDVSLNQSDL